MSSDPYTYVGARARLEGGIALELRRPLHKYLTVIEVSRKDALRLFCDLGDFLCVAYLPHQRPADLSPITDNDEIDAIVGALAALTDRVSALEEDEADHRLARLEERADDLARNLKTGRARRDDIEGRVGSLKEQFESVVSCLGRLEFRTTATDARITRLETLATPSVVACEAKAADPARIEVLESELATLRAQVCGSTVTMAALLDRIETLEALQ